MQEPIAALESMLENQTVLKGKLAAYAPKIDQALIDFDAYQEEQLSELNIALEDIEHEKHEFEQKQGLYVQQSRDIERKQTQIEQWFLDFNALKSEFELVNKATIKSNLTQLKMTTSRCHTLLRVLKGKVCTPLITVLVKHKTN